jgi:hypothetical protein
VSPAVPVARRPRRTLLYVLVLVFFAPLLLAFLVYYGSNWRPLGHTNHGALIVPARPLAPLALPMISPAPSHPSQPPPLAQESSADSAWLRGKWSLIYIGEGRCDDACRRTLYFMRQTQLSLGSLIPRVQRAWLATDQCCDPAADTEMNPPLLEMDAQGEAATAWLTQFPADHRNSTIFIVDPRGNLMMRYDSSADPKGLREDLKKLLGLSSIG